MITVVGLGPGDAGSVPAAALAALAGVETIHCPPLDDAVAALLAPAATVPLGDVAHLPPDAVVAAPDPEALRVARAVPHAATVPDRPVLRQRAIGARVAHLAAVGLHLRAECPWDREQTAASIVPHTIEEAYEVADAIAGGDPAKQRDELIAAGRQRAAHDSAVGRLIVPENRWCARLCSHPFPPCHREGNDTAEHHRSGHKPSSIHHTFAPIHHIHTINRCSEICRTGSTVARHAPSMKTLRVAAKFRFRDSFHQRRLQETGDAMRDLPRKPEESQTARSLWTYVHVDFRERIRYRRITRSPVTAISRCGFGKPAPTRNLA